MRLAFDQTAIFEVTCFGSNGSCCGFLDWRRSSITPCSLIDFPKIFFLDDDHVDALHGLLNALSVRKRHKGDHESTGIEAKKSQ